MAEMKSMHIMSNSILRRRQFTRKLALAVAGMSALATPIVVGILNTPTIRAQSTPALPKFEVASIKLCKGEEVEAGKGGGGGRIRWDPQRLTEECQSLDNLIRYAYLAYPEGKAWTAASREEPSADASGVSCTGCGGRGVPPFPERIFYQEIQGSPGWGNSARYTIDAKAEHPATLEMMRGPVMQALLEERFRLKIHWETRDTPAYELTVAGGPKLQPSHDGSCITFSEMRKLTNNAPWEYRGLPQCDGWNSRDGKTTFANMTIARFCQYLSSNVDRDVIDKTGIAGLFDLQIDAGRVLLPVADSPPRDDGMPFMPETDYAATAKAFQRALPKIGLKLEPAKGAGMFLVIDHVERPSEN